MMPIKKATVITNAGLETALELTRLATDELALEVANSNDQDLSAFTVAVKFHADGAYHTIASIAADFTAPVGFMWAASGSLVTLAKNSAGWLVLKGLATVYALRIQATAAAASTTLTVTGQAK